MISKMGLVFFILGCFGALSEYIKPSEWSGWIIVTEFVLVFGASVFVFSDNKEK